MGNALRKTLVVTWWGWCCLATWLQAQSTTPVTVDIHLQHGHCREDLVRVSHIAKITGASQVLTQQLLELDLTDFGGAPDVDVTRQLVELRIRLALPQVRVNFSGPERVRIHHGANRIRESDVVEQLRQSLSDVWNVKSDRVKLQLLQPLPEVPDGIGPYEIETVVPIRVRPGSLRAKLMLRQGEQLVQAWNISVSAYPQVDVVVARNDLPRGHLVQAADLTIDRQTVTDLHNRSTPPEYYAGQTMIRHIAPGERLQPHHVRKQQAKKEYAVKSRDTVRLVARKAGLSVTVTDAIALESGQIGDSVRVKNPSSKKVVVGQVVSPFEVEIKLR